MSVSVSYHEHGRIDAPPLILSSSLGTTAQLWSPQVGELTRPFRVITYDHRGHGESPVPLGPYDLEDLALDVVYLMDRLSIGRAHFAGISLGGMVGMWLGTHVPDRLDRLALLSTFPKATDPGMWIERAGKVRASGVASMAEASVERWFTADFREANLDVVERYRSILTTTPAEGYAACCEAIASLDLTPDLASITAPTMVIAGTEDVGEANPEVGRKLAGEIWNGSYREVPAAHLANVEQPESVAALMMEHLS